MADIIITMLPDEIALAAFGNGPEWQALGMSCLARAIIECPTGGGDGDGPRLREHMDMIVQGGADPMIQVGSTLTRAGNVSALDLIENGTTAHPIDAKKAKVLRFTSKGVVVFRKHVEHPGSVPNKFVERAIQQAVVQAGGAAFGV